jgi:hypothetical protein
MWHGEAKCVMRSCQGIRRRLSESERATAAAEVAYEFGNK